MIEVKWLMILPLGSIAAFAVWVFWNLTKEVRAEKRRWVRKYSDPDVHAHRQGKTPGAVSARALHRS